MIELQLACYLIGIGMAFAGAPWWACLGAWAIGALFVWRPWEAKWPS